MLKAWAKSQVFRGIQTQKNRDRSNLLRNLKSSVITEKMCFQVPTVSLIKGIVDGSSLLSLEAQVDLVDICIRDQYQCFGKLIPTKAGVAKSFCTLPQNYIAKSM